MKILVILVFVLLIVVTAVLAEKNAPLPKNARPAKRVMFLCALAGALGVGWTGYTLLAGGPRWWLVGGPVVIAAALGGVALSFRAMVRALRRPPP